MSLELFVPLKLDKPRKGKLTIDDMIEVYDTLNADPRRKTEINGWTVHIAMGALDWKVWDTMLWAFLRHQDPAIETPDDAHAILARYIEREGGDALVPIGEAIRLAMMKSGALPRKVWEASDGKKLKRKAAGVESEIDTGRPGIGKGPLDPPEAPESMT